MTQSPHSRPVMHGSEVTANAQARDAWLAALTELLPRHLFVAGVWLVGSLGRGGDDGYSDVDLVVAVDSTVPAAVLADPATLLRVPDTVLLYTRPKPRNAPAGGAYEAVCIRLAGLPVLVDLYLWPAATAAVPDGARILYARTEPPRSDLAFMTLLDRHRSGDTTGADPDHPATVLLLVQLAAKYQARGDVSRRDGIHQQLHLPTGGTLAVLRDVLDQRIDLARWPAFQPAVAAVHRLLDIVESAHRPDRPTIDPTVERTPSR